MASETKEKESPRYTFIKTQEMEAGEEGETVRCVEPYVFHFSTFAKGRWLHRPLLDILSKEFGGYNEAYWVNAIDSGRVIINGKETSTGYIVQNSDRIVHKTHRHEPPVKGAITLVGETNDLFAVCKPASMPMHPCGGYRYNSLSYILSQEPLVPNQATLFSVHRLDRVTSGLVIFAKSKTTAALISKEIRENLTEKIYVARVKGNIASNRLNHLEHLNDDILFAPTESEDVVNTMSKCSEKKRSHNEITGDSSTDSKVAYVVPNNSIGYGWKKKDSCVNTTEMSAPSMLTHDLVVRCPVDVENYREGIHKCVKSGKPALSTFSLLAYNDKDDTSVVYCKPHTGRTHQLRLHLQLIGNPIANDPCYGGTLFFGEPNKLERALSVYRKLQRQGGRTLSKLPHLQQILSNQEMSNYFERSNANEDGGMKNDEKCNNAKRRLQDETEEEFLIRNCRFCQDSQTETKDEMLLHCDGIWLHALEYRGKNGCWKFKSDLPSWARLVAESELQQQQQDKQQQQQQQ